MHMTADTAILASLTVPAKPEQVRAAREFIRDTLDDHVCAESAVLLASELVTNSVLHSASRLDGTVTITVVDVLDGGIRVEVTDAGGGSVPVLRSGGGAWAEAGRGLQLVEDLSANWGYRIEQGGRLVTWFEVKHPR
jgi:anti-sigma regulatory factor (Ser/Thr protein kinase)